MRIPKALKDYLVAPEGLTFDLVVSLGLAYQSYVLVGVVYLVSGCFLHLTRGKIWPYVRRVFSKNKA